MDTAIAIFRFLLVIPILLFVVWAAPKAIEWLNTITDRSRN